MEAAAESSRESGTGRLATWHGIWEGDKGKMGTT